MLRVLEKGQGILGKLDMLVGRVQVDFRSCCGVGQKAVNFLHKIVAVYVGNTQVQLLVFDLRYC